MPETTPSLHFEEVESNLGVYVKRAKVVGGWLVVTIDAASTSDSTGPGYFETHWDREWRSSIAFYPDPHHLWSYEAAKVQRIEQKETA